MARDDADGDGADYLVILYDCDDVIGDTEWEVHRSTGAGFSAEAEAWALPAEFGDDGTTPFGSLKIGPGVAPGAQLYALRVFGCAGSTTLTTAAIDWAVDPNHAGDFSDHLAVINMSLGGQGQSQVMDDAIHDAVGTGCIVLVAAGNDDQDASNSTPAGSSGRYSPLRKKMSVPVVKARA